MQTDGPKYIVVIGASAGGLQATIELVAQLTEVIDAAIFVVLHTPNFNHKEVIINRLQNNSVFTCKMAEHEETIRSRYLYLAVPDYHLILKKGRIILGKGPVENRWRPSIDVLFRSAAVAYDGRVIGIILTGLLEDGVSGMQTIKQCGGTCIVQDPQEAEYPDMPEAVLRLVEVDYCTTLSRIAMIVQEKTKDAIESKDHPIPEQVLKEAGIAERVAVGIDDMARLGGERSAYSCPQCGGALWESRDESVLRYRCHTGHVFSVEALQEAKHRELEDTFWVALRILEERRNLLTKMAEEESNRGWVISSGNKLKRAEELETHIKRLKDILLNSTDVSNLNRFNLESV